MELLIQIGLFAFWTAVLVYAADNFVLNAEKLGLSLKLPHFLTGVLIVSIGTSLPELSTGLASVARGEVDMLAGNVFGSNIANVYLGLGLISVLAFKNITFKQNIFTVHFPVLVISMVLSLAMLVDDREINQTEGIFLLLVLGAYLWFLIAKDQQSFVEKLLPAEKFRWRYVILSGVTLTLVMFSSGFLIDSVIAMASLFGDENLKTVLSATLVAVGTSLPELVVGYAAIKRGNHELLVGNILGSNIFNILLILGAGALVAPLTVSTLTFTTILPMTVASIFIYWAISKDQEITKQEGLAMTFLYFFFIGKLYGFF